MNFRKYIYILLPILFVAFGFYLKGQDHNNDILLKAITGNLGHYHYDPVEIDNDFSEKAYDVYLENLDPNKRFFTSEDSAKLWKYRLEIDDLTIAGDYSFFDLSIDLIEKRQVEIEEYITDILSKPFDFDKDESVNFDEDIAYVTNSKELKDRWRKYLKYNALSRIHTDLEAQENRTDEGFVPASFDSLEIKARKNIRKTHADWFRRLSRLDRKERLTTYVNSLTVVYDPHTNYFPPKDKANFDISMSGRLEGIGAQLQESDGYIKVTRIIVGGPASLQGDLKKDDLILKVKQENEKAVDIVDWKIDEAVKLIRGKKGTKVTLTVRKPDGKQIDIKITRDVVVLEETYAKSLVISSRDDFKAGYIFLPSFYADFDDRSGRFSWKDVKAEVEKLKAENVNGIILDLRNNGGGSLTDVIKIAGLFIDEGPVVQVKVKDRRATVMRDDEIGVAWDGSLVIMVNEFSASASEIMAAAMQDYGRAVILGSAYTHGKGTVQRFLNLNETIRSKDVPVLGHIKLTTQKFYRVNGDATQLKGVRSDVIVPDHYMYLETGEKEHDYPLEWDQINGSAYLAVNVVPEGIVDSSQARVNSNSTFQLVEDNAKNWQDQKERDMYPLNWDEYNRQQEDLKKENEKYSQIMNHPIEGFVVENPQLDQEHISSDSSRVKRNEDWVKNVQKDIYIYEALQIINDWNLKSASSVEP